ncbi:deacetylase [Jiulongibacter sediminis]|uniref:Deacetylase n=1 Tax=Jiulongibacter sediminis TaxID=1605367 RepID=A0A0P7BU21_9BACT|nr:deacetylase [Jiulongibacter sediminis]TBX24338.1 deacetylase [Jiulongibacter sediminis]
MKVAFDPVYCHPLPEGHRFPMEKYELIPGQLLYECSYDQSDFFSPKPLKWELAAQVHTAEYIEALQKQTVTAKEARKIGLPMSAELVKRELIITQGTVDCCDFAIQNGVALNVAGGTHHAYAGSGEGFCILNDFAVAGAQLLTEGKVSKILIIDLDVHQGNGTAKIFENEKRVFTFSMHGKDNYPLRKEVSDLDIPLETGLSDKEYLSILRSTLDRLIAEQKPDILFYVSGVDILETDKLGKLSLSLEGCKERDRIVLETSRKKDIPLVIAMGGGYSKQLRVIVEAHCNTFRLAKEIFN